MQKSFLWHGPYLQRPQGVLDGVPRGLGGPPGPFESAALSMTARLLTRAGQASRSAAVVQPPRQFGQAWCMQRLSPATPTIQRPLNAPGFALRSPAVFISDRTSISLVSVEFSTE